MLLVFRHFANNRNWRTEEQREDNYDRKLGQTILSNCETKSKPSSLKFCLHAARTIEVGEEITQDCDTKATKEKEAELKEKKKFIEEKHTSPKKKKGNKKKGAAFIYLQDVGKEEGIWLFYFLFL